MTRAIMIDLETLGKRPGCIISSIGAVVFDPRSDWIGDTLHTHIDWADSELRGFKADIDTVKWWLKQDDAAASALVAGQDDASLVASFERIEAARAGTTLTFFEYNTLAALDLFARAPVDVAVLEVGLGGRLDATNIVDADVGIGCSIGLDHVDDPAQLMYQDNVGLTELGPGDLAGLAAVGAGRCRD